MAYIIECIYKARSFNLVIPLSFIMNLVTYLTTRCQSMNKVVAKICPGGSYTHISKWIAANTKDKLIPQSACLKWSMDNSQRICKSWLLRPQSKMPTSICTANSYIVIGNYGLQHLLQQAPPKWLKLDRMPCFELQHEATFRAVRQEFLVKRLHKLKQSQIDIDTLTEQLHNSKTVKGCNDVNCQCINEPSFRVCHVCRLSDLGKVLFNIDDSETATNPKQVKIS